MPRRRVVRLWTRERTGGDGVAMRCRVEQWYETGGSRHEVSRQGRQDAGCGTIPNLTHGTAAVRTGLEGSWCSWLRWRVGIATRSGGLGGKQAAAQCQLVGALAIGEEAVVADAVQAVG